MPHVGKGNDLLMLQMTGITKQNCIPYLFFAFVYFFVFSVLITF